MDEEEAIPTNDTPLPQGDNGGIGAPAPAAAAPQQAIPTGDDNSIPEGPVQVQDNAPPKRHGPLGKIVSYLMGEGAVPPQVLQQAANQIDPESTMSASDRNVMVIKDAADRGGPDAAWKMVQANRVAYNAKQAFAYSALNGTQQKPPDINAAVQAANQAADHILDGSNVKFAPAEGGVTATVTDVEGQQHAFNLTPDQFRKYLNVGGAGQWDRQMQGGVARTLMQLTQAPAAKQGAPAQQQATAPKENVTMGAKPANGMAPELDQSTGYSPELQQRAHKLYPVGSASNFDRENYMSTQQGQADTLKNKVDVAEATGESRTEAARARAGGATEQQRVKNEGALAVQGAKNEGWKYASDAKTRAAQIAADQKAAHDGNVDARARIETARKAIATKRMSASKLTPEDEALEKQLTAAASGQQQAAPAQQQAAPAQQQAPAQAVPPADKRVVNQVYNTPKGPHRWMGNGWQPVQ